MGRLHIPWWAVLVAGIGVCVAGSWALTEIVYRFLTFE